MKNLYLKCCGFAVLLFSNYQLSAQRVVTVTENNKNQNSNIQFKSLLSPDYKLIEERNGEKTYIMEGIGMANNASKANVTLTVNLTFDENEFPYYKVYIYNENGYWKTISQNQHGSIQIPEGTYDILAKFTTINSNDSFVVREQVVISNDTTVDIAESEATNEVATNMFDENGNALEPGVFDAENNFTSHIILDRNLIFKPKKVMFGHSFDSSVPHPESIPIWNFRINNVSDRYQVVQNASATGYTSGKHYFTKFSTLNGIQSSQTLENNPQDWVYHKEKFEKSLLGTATNDSYYPAFVSTSVYENFVGVVFYFYYRGGTYDITDGMEMYLNNPIDNDPNRLLVSPALNDYQGKIDPSWGDTDLLIQGNAVVKEGNGVLYGSGASSTAAPYQLLGSGYYLNYQALPFHPAFSYSASGNENIIQGTNVPISVFGFDQWTGQLKANYVGRYGEIRESDFLSTNVEVKQNGSTVFNGNYVDNAFFSYSFPASGKMDVTFTNNNMSVDGLESKNITHLEFEQGTSDAVPPTLQHLQFRDTDNKVTDRFASADKGTIRIAGADFDYNKNYIGGQSVELYYSLYNQDNWSNIPLTTDPGNLFLPAFGDLYTASLSNVIVPQDNSWFDVKVIIKDATGNKQEQIISPAFKIAEKSLAVSDVKKSDFIAYPNPFTNELNIQLPENMKGNVTFKVTDLSGKTVYTQNRQNEKSFVFNGSSLPKGVYIVTVENNGKVVAKKVIKK